MNTRTGLGQASKRFLTQESSKPCLIGGVQFEELAGFASSSDGDVVYHSICQAITSLIGTPILDGLADEWLAKEGITDSGVYLSRALPLLAPQRITHVAISLEALHPRLNPHLLSIRQNVSTLLQIELKQVGCTNLTGEGLTNFGCGDGVHCLTIITTEE